MSKTPKRSTRSVPRGTLSGHGRGTPPAGPVKITRPDGTVEFRPPLHRSRLAPNYKLGLPRSIKASDLTRHLWAEANAAESDVQAVEGTDPPELT